MGARLTRALRAADLTGFIARRSLASFLENRGLERAAVLSYNSFFSLFPLMLLLLYLLGRFMASSQSAMGAIEQLAAQVSPYFGEVVLREVRGLATQNAWGLVSLAMLLWGVTPMAGALRGAFDVIYKTDRARPFFKEKLKDVLAVLVMIILLILLVAGEVAYSVVTHRLAALSWAVRWLDVVVPLVVAMGFLLFIHYVFSPVRPAFLAVLTGCAVSALLLAVLNPTFSAVVRFDPNYGVAFGSLKAVFLLLVWVYACFVTILIGAEVAAGINRRDALLVSDLLSGLSTSHVRQLARMTRFVKTFGMGEVVFGEGDPGDTMYYVAQGGVVLKRGPQVLRVMKPGEYFGEMAMLIKAPRSASAVVTEPGTQLVAIAAANIEIVLRENPKVVLSLLREMAERLRQTNEIVGR
jgi:YihY family inner membrane protein